MWELAYYLALGYLIGSVSPGYFFGRTIKKIDIRNFGNKNTGATNTYRTIGLIYVVITGIIDLTKSPFAYFIAVYGVAGITAQNPDIGILVGLATVLGHIFPFYLGFRGGRGVASLYGLNALNLAILQNFTPYSLLFFIGTVFYSIAVSQRPETRQALGQAPIREFLQLGGLIFPLGYIFAQRNTILWIVGTFFIALLVFDIFRLTLPGLNTKYLNLGGLAKRKELKRLSGYTLFFLANFILITFFAKEIAVLAMSVAIVGDVFAPFGNVFSSKIIWREKSWGGLGLIFLMTFIVGSFLKSLSPLNFATSLVLIAAILSAVIDLFSSILDDNILVPIGVSLILVLIF